VAGGIQASLSNWATNYMHFYAFMQLFKALKRSFVPAANQAEIGRIAPHITLPDPGQMETFIPA